MHRTPRAFKKPQDLLCGMLVWVLTSTCAATPAHISKPIEDQSTSELEAYIEYIDHTLTELADFQMTTGMGPIGYRSKGIASEEWVEIRFKQSHTLDQVVVVPTLWRSTRDGPKADAFPEAFRILALKPSGEQILLAEYSEDDQITPRIAPLVIDCEPQLAIGLRLEATKLNVRAWDKVACLQLAEILAFSGNDNVALHQEVLASSSEDADPRKRSHLVDGFLPYIMGLKTGKQSIAFLASYPPELEPEIVIDLGGTYPLSSLNLHAIESSDTIPQTVPSDYAFPRHFIIEGANKADFSDATPLFEYKIQSLFDIGPILSERFNPTSFRYIRLRILKSYVQRSRTTVETQLGFAEIEVIADGVNVAKGKTVRANVQPSARGRDIENLTDGHNFFGQIIPIRTWLEELALRHDLERQRPLVAQALKENYARQSAILNQLTWLVVVVVIIAIFVTALMRLMAQRSIQRLRERIAADLHDELGANLHAIGLLSDLSDKAKGSPTKLSNLLQRIRNLTERTGAAARHCTNMLEAEELYSDVAEHFQRVSRRMLSDMHYNLEMEGTEHLTKLSPRRRIDLCLFYQECLTNIMRHSGASEVHTTLKVAPHQVALTISDNGIGLDQEHSDQIPKSISRRSRLLGSKLSVDSPQGGGTRISLIFSLRRFFFPLNP